VTSAAVHQLLLGIDAGGTKTECALVSLTDGRVAHRFGRPSNYQAVGIRAAAKVWRDLIDACCSDLNASPDQISGAGLGIAGLDRPKDEERIAAAFDAILPGKPRVLVNDAYLVLRAGTPDGVGVTAISGTGANAMGQAPSGKRARVNGLGPDFGDVGSASDIGAEAVKRAFKSLDGREEPTSLVQYIASALNLEHLTDLVDLMLFDSNQPDAYRPGLLAPLVFQAAGHGDAVATDILSWAGDELGHSALAVARSLFSHEELFPVVLGGSVFQRGRSTHMIDALMARLSSEFPKAHSVMLEARPVAGALRYALDVSHSSASGSATVESPYVLLDRIAEDLDHIDTVALLRGDNDQPEAP